MVALTPMLPTAGPLPSGPSWLFEVKWDGFRAIVQSTGRLLSHSARGGIKLHTRSGRDVTAQLPELYPLSGALGRSAVLDGELIVMGDDGRPDFERVRRRLLSRRCAGDLVQLVVFDLLALDDQPLVDLPYLERRRRLDDLKLAGEHWHTPPFYADGEALLETTAALGLEGVVAKHCDAPYRPGRRTRDWIKTKHTADCDHVIVGVDERPKGRAYLVARQQSDGSLAYAGRVELVAPHVRRDLALSLRSVPASPIGWRTRRIRWVSPDTHVTVRALASGPGLREGRIVALAR